MTLTKNEIKFLKSLQIKKYRDSHKLFVVEGEKLVNELMCQSTYKIDTVFHTADYAPPKTHLSFNSVHISEKELERISALKSPNKVLATVKTAINNKLNLQESNLVLLLDNIKDPGNLGTIIRTAEWYGIQNIIASEQSVDVFNSKTIQASMGAFYHVKFSYCNLEPFINELKENDFVLAGASLSGTNIYEAKFEAKTALVMGSESHGINPEILKLLDKELLIPRIGVSESLNVGIATGIFLSEYYRQHTHH
ncbi:MAG: TrmH family RNA methyltransferase [Crocinitomicaceae bacterium]